MNKIYFIFLWLPFFVFAQKDYEDFPRDTSFNVQSAARKIAKEFPHAKIVEEFVISSIEERRNLIYQNFGKRKLHIDVFYPKNLESNLPGVLLIHGGGWASGTKSHLIPMAQKLAEAGFIAATIEYRLSPEALYPAGVIDIKTALKWLKINATDFSLDTSKMAVLGTSAGATLASLIGTTVGNEMFNSNIQNSVSDKVHALINIDGIVDFTDPAESGKDNDPQKPSAATRWFGYTIKQKPELWIEASPITYVDKNTTPTIFINSAIPRFHAGRKEFLEVLNQNNIYNEIHTIPETPHPFWLFHPWFDKTWPYVVEFLYKTLQ